MRVLVVGSGGREHALAYRLSMFHEVFCAPGNPGIGREVPVFSVAASDQSGLVDLAVRLHVDLVVVGPEDPLIDGLADRLRGAGIATFGPSRSAARLEGSKDFSKRLMVSADVPTAAFSTFTNPVDASEYARSVYAGGAGLAVKASGNALGRGVSVCETLESALDAIDAAMVRKAFGSAGEILVLEELLVGREFSLLTVVGDKNLVSLPIAQDYKRALDGDQGPNTGGMGSFSPCDWATEELVMEVEARMVHPILNILRDTGSPFTGMLFTGVMVTDRGPRCLEYNVRFGDPETQSLMMRIQGDFGQALLESATGQLIQPVSVSNEAAVTVIVGSGGYPGEYKKGCEITLSEIPDKAKLFFAGVSERDGILVNSGGRVVAASATGLSVEIAREIAYKAAAAVAFDGAYFRKDIASDA